MQSDREHQVTQAAAGLLLLILLILCTILSIIREARSGPPRVTEATPWEISPPTRTGSEN
jgi:hypothetical protein